MNSDPPSTWMDFTVNGIFSITLRKNLAAAADVALLTTSATMIFKTSA